MFKRRTGSKTTLWFKISGRTGGPGVRGEAWDLFVVAAEVSSRRPLCPAVFLTPLQYLPPDAREAWYPTVTPAMPASRPLNNHSSVTGLCSQELLLYLSLHLRRMHASKRRLSPICITFIAKESGRLDSSLLATEIHRRKVERRLSKQNHGIWPTPLTSRCRLTFYWSTCGSPSRTSRSTVGLLPCSYPISYKVTLAKMMFFSLKE